MNYFIALVPQITKTFYEKVMEVLEFKVRSEVNFPFHVTLRYFPLHKGSNTLKAWFEKLEKNPPSCFQAICHGVDCFKEEGKDKVYFLDISAPEIQNIRQKTISLKPLNQEIFQFHPHLSIVFPLENFSNEEKKKIKKIFEDVKNLEFDKIALFSEKNKTFKIEKIVSLKR